MITKQDYDRITGVDDPLVIAAVSTRARSVVSLISSHLTSFHLNYKCAVIGRSHGKLGRTHCRPEEPLFLLQYSRTTITWRAV